MRLAAVTLSLLGACGGAAAFRGASLARRGRVQSASFSRCASILSTKAKEVAANPPAETVFFEGPPSWTEAVVPAISIITVLGLVPFAAAVSRQVWTRYKITNLRLSIQSGWGGNDLVEVVYRDITSVKFIYRFGGLAGDMVMELSDGAKLEIRSMPDFARNYDYIMSKVSPACRAASDYKPLTDDPPQPSAE